LADAHFLKLGNSSFITPLLESKAGKTSPGLSGKRVVEMDVKTAEMIRDASRARVFFMVVIALLKFSSLRRETFSASLTGKILINEVVQVLRSTSLMTDGPSDRLAIFRSFTFSSSWSFAIASPVLTLSLLSPQDGLQ